jgi:hypothetical protein
MPFSNRLIFKPMELKIQQLKELYEKDFPPVVGREFKAFGKQRIRPGGLGEPFGGNKGHGTKAFGCSHKPNGSDYGTPL